MGIDTQLESYLSALDKALGSVPVSARAEIVTEIKSHILEAQERDPSAKLGSILSALGEPQSVATRYLLERGLKPVKASRSPMIKWLTIGFLGTFAILCLTFTMLVWRFTPLITIDEENDRVTLLGGIIDVDGKAGHARIGSFSFTDDGDSSSVRSVGAKALDPKVIKDIRIPFVNGKIDITTSSDNELRWNCKVKNKGGTPKTSEQASIFAFDFGTNASIKCDIQIPAKMKSSILGVNGKLNIDKPQGDIHVELKNGKVAMAPSATTKYNYNLTVKNGVTDTFESSNSPDALKIKMEIGNGAISHDDDEADDSDKDY